MGVHGFLIVNIQPVLNKRRCYMCIGNELLCKPDDTELQKQLEKKRLTKIIARRRAEEAVMKKGSCCPECNEHKGYEFDLLYYGCAGNNLKMIIKPNILRRCLKLHDADCVCRSSDYISNKPSSYEILYTAIRDLHKNGVLHLTYTLIRETHKQCHDLGINKGIELQFTYEGSNYEVGKCALFTVRDHEPNLLEPEFKLSYYYVKKVVAEGLHDSYGSYVHDFTRTDNYKHFFTKLCTLSPKLASDKRKIREEKLRLRKNISVTKIRNVLPKKDGWVKSDVNVRELFFERLLGDLILRVWTGIKGEKPKGRLSYNIRVILYTKGATKLLTVNKFDAVVPQLEWEQPLSRIISEAYLYIDNMKPCPECHSIMLTRFNVRIGKIYYRCSNYSACCYSEGYLEYDKRNK